MSVCRGVINELITGRRRRGRDYGHIRFALTTITRIFAASSGRGEIYTAGRRRLCLPLPGEDEPEEKKGKPGSASRTRHVFTELGGRGWRWLGSSWGKGGPEGQPQLPPLSLSSAHPSISDVLLSCRDGRVYTSISVLLCHRDGAGLSPGAHFTGEDVDTLHAPAWFAQQPLLRGIRGEPQWVSPSSCSIST